MYQFQLVSASTKLSDSVTMPRSIHTIIKHSANHKGMIPYETFMKIALYDHKFGYYKQKKNRVGYHQNSDFYTATNLSPPLLYRLITAAIKDLLPSQDLQNFVFVEIGPEPNLPIDPTVEETFSEYLPIPIDQPIEIPKKSIVFANELLDAQPFRRLCCQERTWLEEWVCVNEPQDYFPVLEKPHLPLPQNLPQEVCSGYRIDYPQAAENLLSFIHKSPWQGLFLTFDYGKSQLETFHHCPQGTARAYHNHQLVENLWQNPGQKDLTCHLIWDHLQEIISTPSHLQSLESFFITHAREEIKIILENYAKTFNQEKQSLIQLLHPAHMGQKFQALYYYKHF